MKLCTEFIALKVTKSLYFLFHTEMCLGDWRYTYIAEGQTTHHRKRMSRDRYRPLLCDVTARVGNMSRDGHVLLYDVTARALHSNGPSAYIENTVPVLLAACVLRALSSNGSTRHITINNENVTTVRNSVFAAAVTSFIIRYWNCISYKILYNVRVTWPLLTTNGTVLRHWRRRSDCYFGLLQSQPRNYNHSQLFITLRHIYTTYNHTRS
jgi:hypothetical protein